MMRYLKVFLLSLVVIGLLTGSATAARLYNSQGNEFGGGTNTTNSYRIAYELYSETAGVSTIAERGEIRILLEQPLALGQTANLVMSTPVKADWNSAGGTYKWALRRVSDNAIIGTTPAAGLITPNLPFNIVANANAGNELRVIQWDDADNDGIIDGGETVIPGAGIYVRPGLGATCGIMPIIQIEFTTPHETTAGPLNFAYITPQYAGIGPAADSLNAELDTDFDFNRFILGTGPNVNTSTKINVSNFINITDNATNVMWIAYLSSSPVGNFSFKINSIAGEPATSMKFDLTPCTANTARTQFTCSETGVPLIGAKALELIVSGTISNEPTNWSLSDFSVTTAGLAKPLCVSIPPSSIGIWHGGLEVFVPFVKGGEGYATYVVLYNRYNRDAKVFVSTFKDSGSNPIMISTSQITGKEFIPANGKLVITDADIYNFLIGRGYTWNPADGIPVKFSVRVPSQTGLTTHTVKGTISWPNFSGSGTINQQNPKDPYVEGIVVSTYPGGGQRSIPLKFKHFKNGEYSH